MEHIKIRRVSGTARRDTQEKRRVRQDNREKGSDGALLFKTRLNKGSFVWSAERVEWSQDLGRVERCALTAFLLCHYWTDLI